MNYYDANRDNLGREMKNTVYEQKDKNVNSKKLYRLILNLGLVMAYGKNLDRAYLHICV